MNFNILITGASGFIGSSLVPYLKTKYSVQVLSLRNYATDNRNFENVQSIIHLAGVAHKMNNENPNDYFKVNRDLTIRFAQDAKKAGVSQFIYISSTKVYGEESIIYNESSVCLPSDPYGKSKLEAEIELKKIESDSFSVAIIRPPLVYGANVKGNMLKLMSLLIRFKIIPLGGIKNQRSMVYIGNLVALIEHIVLNQSSGLILAGDKKQYSTTELVYGLSKGLNSNNIIISLPYFVRMIISKLRPELSKRLFESLIFENKHSYRKINFTPPYSFNQGIDEMTAQYLSENYHG